MIEIDGSVGEGGGQILRSSLSLAMCTGKSVSLKNIRSGRKKPGLMRQHLVCVQAACQISGGKAEGAHLKSQELIFTPKKVRSGNYQFSIGTAGSTTLVFQTILPALLQAKEASTLEFVGGTHNPLAPSLDFLEHAFLPSIRKMGCKVELEVERFGFFPAGGGKWKATIHPPSDKLEKVKLLEQGKLQGHRAVVYLSDLPEHIRERELQVLKEKLNWGEQSYLRKEIESDCPGNVVALQIEFEHVCEVFDALGERHLSAERVAQKALENYQRYLKAGVPVGEYLADQLLLPISLAGGGKFRTLLPSDHTKTNAHVIQQFLDLDIQLNEIEENRWEINVA